MNAPTDTVIGIEELVAEMVQTLLLNASLQQPSSIRREEISEEFAKDTVNLVLTFIANNPSIMDGPYQEDPFANVGLSSLQ